MAEKYLKPKELREMYSVSAGTVHGWMKEGLPCVRFGNQILRFEIGAVQKWLAENKQIDKHPRSLE